MTTQEVEYVRNMIREVNVLQTVNAILQYCPQFMFQAFLIVYKKYKCVITGQLCFISIFKLSNRIKLEYVKEFAILSLSEFVKTQLEMSNHENS